MLKVTLIGNLGADPDMRYTPDGNPVTTMRVACDTGKDQTTWVQLAAWNKLAELCNTHLSKGNKVYAEGRLKVDTWDGRDGDTMVSIRVTADTVRFLSPKSAEAEEPEGVTTG